MKKLLFLFFIFILPLNVLALTYPKLHYQSALVYDMTDEKYLYSLAPEEKRSIASLTKVMTTITALENINNLDEKVTITSEMLSLVRWDASIAGLKVGDEVTYRDLLYASILPSGADATISLGILTSGSIDNFVTKMNELAKKIGMTNSHFVNVHGLDEEGHYSTAEDIKKLLQYALKNPTFKEIYTTKKYTLTNGLVVKSTVQKVTDVTSIDTSRIIGSKTGFTLNAGQCISAIFLSNQHEILLITLGATKEGNQSFHVTDALELIDFIDENYANQTIISKNQDIKKIKVNLSTIEYFTIKNSQELSLYLPNDYNKDDIKIEYDGLKELSYKNKLNEEIGTITYYYQDSVLAEEKVVLNIEIEPDYLKIIGQYKIPIIIIFFIIVIIFVLLIISLKGKKRNSKK